MVKFLKMMFIIFFREYPRYMEDWIKHISEGETAFNNEEKYKPYKIVSGEKVLLKSGHMGNKFRRLFWDKPGACIATRNDQLASQDTIHPKDNRVLSIRELMRLMTIPDDFKWSKVDLNSLSNLKLKRQYLKENELNIRRCIGEAVPTHIMQSIAKNAKEILEFQDYVENYYSNKIDLTFSKNNSFYIKAFNYEMGLKNAKDTGSYYTPQTVVYESLSTLVLPINKKLKILEPSVGMGAFIPQLLRLCDMCENVIIDLCDIDKNTITALKNSIKSIKYNKQNIKIRFINEDFLITDKLYSKYDVIISNPPFARCNSNKLEIYKKLFNVGKSNNLFAFFLDKYIGLSDEIVVILPKSFIMASEYNEIRRKYEDFGIKHIVDFGVKYFKDVFVEILSFHFKKNYNGFIKIENKLEKNIFYQKQDYIFHNKCWLLYRDEWFDNYIISLKLNVFDFFRDRQITNKKTLNFGDVRVIRSKNILDNGEIVSKPGYDKFINATELSNYRVSDFLNSNAIIMPSFTYLTRATRLPDNCITNGSIAILLPKNLSEDEIDLSLYSTDDFRRYYQIIKNKAKFTLNMDSNSVYYIGVKKND